MSIWTTSKVSDENLSRLGLFDICLGTDHAENSLNVAIAAGHKHIMLAKGAVLTANLTIPSGHANGYIVGFGGPKSISLGAYTIDVAAAGFKLQGFRLSGIAASPVGITISGTAAEVELRDIFVGDFSSHGIEISSTGNEMVIEGCSSYSNGGDGVKVAAASATARIHNNFIWANTGWGINDLSNTIIEGGNRLDNNAAGARNTSSTSIDGKSKVA